MSNILTPPHLLFTDIDGSPLGAGLVYVGASGQEPETNPIQVYWDKEKTIVAEQPIHTRNGYISKDGVPSTIFVDTNSFSVSIKNRNQDQIYKVLSFDQFVGVDFVEGQVASERERAIAAEGLLSNSVGAEQNRAMAAEQALSTALGNETNRATAAELALQSQINSLGVGNKAYLTYAAMDADKANIPTNSKVTVTSDPDTSKRGDWQWNGSVFTKSPYDPLTQSKTYTDSQISQTVTYIDNSLYPIDPESNPSSGWLYAVTDRDGKVLFGIDNQLIAKFLDGVQGKSLSTLSTSIVDNSNAKFFNIADKNGNLLAFIDEFLSANFVGVNTSKLLAGNISIDSNPLVTQPVVLSDVNGNILGYFDADGHFTGLGTSFSSGAELEPRIYTDYVHVSMQGQSLALGLGAGSIATLASEAPNALVPSAGIEDGVQGGDMQGVTGLPLSSSSIVAFNPTLNPNQTAESPLYAAIVHLQKSFESRSVSSQVLGSTNGHGGTAIAGLSKGTAIYDVGVAQSKAYRDYASTSGKSCLSQFVLWVQGETDISNGLSGEEYITRLNKLIADYQTDINQDLAPIMLTYQTGSHTKRWPTYSPEIPYSQLKVSNQNPSIKLACPTYVMPYNADGIHMPPNSYRWLGAYFGKVMDWMLVNNRTDWKPVQPEKIVRNGRVVTIQFHVPVKPLVLDTTLVTNPGNYGFKVFDATNTEQTISSVSILNGDTVKIVLSAAPTSNVTVKYALGTNNTNAGPTTGARGNIRDSDATVAKVLDLTTGQPYPLQNWCPIFSLQEGFSWVQ